jgi:hypothetical protein
VLFVVISCDEGTLHAATLSGPHPGRTITLSMDNTMKDSLMMKLSRVA